MGNKKIVPPAEEKDTGSKDSTPITPATQEPEIKQEAVPTNENEESKAPITEKDTGANDSDPVTPAAQEPEIKQEPTVKNENEDTSTAPLSQDVTGAKKYIAKRGILHNGTSYKAGADVSGLYSDEEITRLKKMHVIEEA